jgi:DNA helicase-2/ATP-dependent DNA helicase PcrA
MTKLNADKGKSRWDMAILYRTNAQSGPLEQVLVQEWIPYKIYGGFKFFERKEIKDILWYLKVILNPQDSVSVKRIINTPKRKIWPDTIAKIEEYAIANGISLREALESLDSLPLQLGTMASNAIKQFMTMMRYLKQSAPTLDPSRLIQQILDNIKYKDYLISVEWKEIWEEKYENIGQLINMASKYTVS